MKTITKAHKHEKTNLQTGEITEKTTYNSFKVEEEPPFIKLYLRDICKLNDIPQKGNLILMELLKYTSYNNEIMLPAGIRKRIEEELNLAQGVLNNHLSSLVKKEILKRVSTGVFQLNPHLFGKGKWQDIKELRVTWGYSQKGRVVEGVETSTHYQPDLPFNGEINCAEVA